jgi:diketogulonate reductase-like aldo/keto reductase
LHPFAQQKAVVEYCKKNGIVIEAYCPIVRNRKADDPTIAAIAKAHGVSPNQVLIRWSLQKGFVPLPKSDNPDRIKLNAELYSFTLSADDVAKIDGLDQGAAGAIVQAVT